MAKPPSERDNGLTRFQNDRCVCVPQHVEAVFARRLPAFPLIPHRDDAGRPQSWLPHLNGRGRRARAELSRRAALQHRSYTYRADGHLTAVDDQLGGRRQLDLTREGRVRGVTADNWSERYAYDEAGNQTTATTPGNGDADGSREYTGTRITRAGRVRYEHDAQGRVVLRQKARLSRKPDTWHYGWDAEDRLVSVTTPDGMRWRYLYDALGRRVAKQRLSTDGATVAEEVTFTWDGDTLCEQTTSASDSPDTIALTWDHDGVKPVTQVERRLLDQPEVDRRFFAIVTDLVGTPRELVDEQGEVAWHTRATPWGTTTWNRSATAYTPLRFPGQYFDPESGLHYNRHRHYGPESGRYVSPTRWASSRPRTRSRTPTTRRGGSTHWDWRHARTGAMASLGTAWFSASIALEAIPTTLPHICATTETPAPTPTMTAITETRSRPAPYG